MRKVECNRGDNLNPCCLCVCVLFFNFYRLFSFSNSIFIFLKIFFLLTCAETYNGIFFFQFPNFLFPFSFLILCLIIVFIYLFIHSFICTIIFAASLQENRCCDLFLGKISSLKLQDKGLKK